MVLVLGRFSSSKNFKFKRALQPSRDAPNSHENASFLHFCEYKNKHTHMEKYAALPASDGRLHSPTLIIGHCPTKTPRLRKRDGLGGCQDEEEEQEVEVYNQKCLISCIALCKSDYTLM